MLDDFYIAGVDATSTRYREASLFGADGVVIKFRRILLRLNTIYEWLRATALAFAPLIPVCAS
jgi:hypothetical protein